MGGPSRSQSGFLWPPEHRTASSVQAWVCALSSVPVRGLRLLVESVFSTAHPHPSQVPILGSRLHGVRFLSLVSMWELVLGSVSLVPCGRGHVSLSPHNSEVSGGHWFGSVLTRGSWWLPEGKVTSWGHMASSPHRFSAAAAGRQRPAPRHSRGVGKRGGWVLHLK